jgi:hypothetical protein
VTETINRLRGHTSHLSLCPAIYTSVDRLRLGSMTQAQLNI